MDKNKDPASPITVRNWHNKYPHQNIVVLSDPEAKMKKWVRPSGMPCMILVDEKMIIKARNLVKEVYMDEKIEQYILDIIFATRNSKQKTSSDM